MLFITEVVTILVSFDFFLVSPTEINTTKLDTPSAR